MNRAEANQDKAQEGLAFWCPKQPSGKLYWQLLRRNKREITRLLYPDWEKRGWTIVRVRLVEEQ